VRKRLWMGGIALTIVAGIALWVGTVDHLDLLDHSTRITSIRGWGLEQPDAGIPLEPGELLAERAQYQWVGKRQILFFHGMKPIQVSIPPPSSPGSSPLAIVQRPASVATPTLYDVATHREQALPRLAQLFHGNNYNVQQATVAPDGTRLFWQSSSCHFDIALLDGSQHAHFDKEPDVTIGWPQDRAEAYTYGWAKDAHMHSIKMQNSRVIAVHFWDRNGGKGLGQSLFVAPANMRMLGDFKLLSNGDLAANTLETNPPPLTLYRISPTPNSVIHSVVPPLPAGTTVEALIYSPQGDRVAWIIDRDWVSPFAFLHRWLPRYAPKPRRTASIWVSGPMGENLHEIGHILFHPKRQQFCLIDYVRWQPDEKNLSFVSNDILYTVPAN